MRLPPFRFITTVREHHGSPDCCAPRHEGTRPCAANTVRNWSRLIEPSLGAQDHGSTIADRGCAPQQKRPAHVRFGCLAMSALCHLLPYAAHKSHFYSITSSASNCSALGTSRPSNLAACALMTNSNLVDCTTGRSAGFAPFRIRPV